MKRPSLKLVEKHLSRFGYMKNINRSIERIDDYGEVFTPSILVSEILDNFPSDAFSDPAKTFLDPSCGDGQFLCEILVRKMKNGIDFETSLSTLYGVDIMEDNIALCRERLLCGQVDLVERVERQIVCANTLSYHFRFDGTPSEGSQLDLFNKGNIDLNKIKTSVELIHVENL